MARPISAREFARAALSARMIGVFILLAIAAVVCVKLGSWQLDRSLERGEAGARAAQQEMLSAQPRPLDEVLAPQTAFRAEHLGAKITARGTYGEQVVIPGRQVDGNAATLVVADLVISSGEHAGAHLPVLRGWMAPDAAVPPPPSGEVEVTGYLANSEQETTTSRTPGTLSNISSAHLVNLWGTPIYSGYLVQESTSADSAGLAMAPPPDLVKDSGRNWQNLGYAVEWFIFGGFALALWVKMVRDEAAHQQRDKEAAAA